MELEELRSILVGTAGLSAAAVVSVVLGVARDRITADEGAMRTALRVMGAALLIQSIHFAEELATGFHVRFPERLGLRAWPTGFFVPFNLFWLAVWGVSIVGLKGRRIAALFPLWFLGIAGAVNGVAHPLLAVSSGSYFPGLLTSPLVGVAGIAVLRQLGRITAARTG